MQHYYETVIDTLTGAAVTNAEVWVFNAGDNSLATLASDAAGATAINLPLLTDSNGYFEFYASDGLYTFEYRAMGQTLRTVPDVPIFDLVDLRADVDALLAAMGGKASTAYVDAADAVLAASIAALDAATYSKAEVDALLAGLAGPDLGNYYTKAQVDALIPVAPTRYYSYGSFAVANILASEILMDHQVAVAHTLPANFAGSVVSVGTPPAADFVLAVQYDGASIGTITIHSDGTWTGATTGGAPVAIAANHYVTTVAPAGVSAAIARVRFTIRGTI